MLRLAEGSTGDGDDADRAEAGEEAVELPGAVSVEVG